MRKIETIIAAIPKDKEVPYEDVVDYEILSGVDTDILLQRLLVLINEGKIDMGTFKLRTTFKRKKKQFT